MFIWNEKQKIGGRGRSGVFASITRKINEKSTNRKRRFNLTFSVDFLETFGIKKDGYVIVGYDKESKRIGIVPTEDENRGYKISKNSGLSSKTYKIAVTIDFPFEIDKLTFEKDEVFKENGIIVFELFNKNIADCIN